MSHLIHIFMYSGQKRSLPDENEDNDLLTDIFASVFGAQCSVSRYKPIPVCITCTTS